MVRWRRRLCGRSRDILADKRLAVAGYECFELGEGLAEADDAFGSFGEETDGLLCFILRRGEEYAEGSSGLVEECRGVVETANARLDLGESGVECGSYLGYGHRVPASAVASAVLTNCTLLTARTPARDVSVLGGHHHRGARELPARPRHVCHLQASRAVVVTPVGGPACGLPIRKWRPSSLGVEFHFRVTCLRRRWTGTSRRRYVSPGGSGAARGGSPGGLRG